MKRNFGQKANRVKPDIRTLNQYASDQISQSPNVCNITQSVCECISKSESERARQ